MNREMEGEDQKYAPSTSGPGSNCQEANAAQGLVERWWPACKKHYRQAVIAFELKKCVQGRVQVEVLEEDL